MQFWVHRRHRDRYPESRFARDVGPLWKTGFGTERKHEDACGPKSRPWALEEDEAAERGSTISRMFRLSSPAFPAQANYRWPSERVALSGVRPRPFDVGLVPKINLRCVGRPFKQLCCLSLANLHVVDRPHNHLRNLFNCPALEPQVP